MSLAPGTCAGPSGITAQIRADGTGEVYRARDMKVSRDVALRILPDAFAQTADRLARFRREAEALEAAHERSIIPTEE